MYRYRRLQPGGYHNLTALATKYYVPKEAIPVGNQDFEDKKKSFATTNGFNNIRFDHIHRAELDYLNGKPGETYENPYTHQPSKYDQLNISRNNAYTQAVNNTNQKAIRQIWNPSNATGQYSDDVRSTLDLSKVKNRVNSTEVFNGGFYPSCKTGLEWGYTGQNWKCTGAIDWDLDLYSFEPAGTQEKDPAGYFAMPWEFKQDPDFLTSYYEAKQDEDTEPEAAIEEIRTVCWAGGLDHQPEFNSGNKGRSGLHVR